MRALLLFLAVFLASPPARADEDEAEQETPVEAKHETTAAEPSAAPPAAAGGLRSSAQDAKPSSRPSGGTSSSGGGSASGAASAGAATSKAAPKGCQVRPAYPRCGSSVTNCPRFSQEPGVPVAYKVPAAYLSVGPNDVGRVVIHHNGGGAMLVSVTNAPCSFTCGGVHTGSLAVLPADSKKDARWRKEHPGFCQLGKGAEAYVNILFTTPCPLRGGCSYLIWQ